MYNVETDQERDVRIRNGRIALVLCIVYWIVTVGGIIMTINFFR